MVFMLTAIAFFKKSKGIRTLGMRQNNWAELVQTVPNGMFGPLGKELVFKR